MFDAATRNAFQGQALIMVKAKSGGAISIDATAPGLKAGHATLRAE